MKFFQNLERKFRSKKFRYDYRGDGFAVRHKNVGFMQEPRFVAAYEWSAQTAHLGKQPPWAAADLRWRAHICVWAAQQALKIEGDFVECGVDTAITSGTVAKYLDFANVPRQFFLFDTFEGIPIVDGMNEDEKRMRESLNSHYYFDSYDFVTAKMANFPNVRLVRGFLPDTLPVLETRKIAYLSIDLNNAPSEKAVMDHIWSQMSPGAIVVIDDYAFEGHNAQYEMWNDFASQNHLLIATLPTGQGLLVKG